MVIYLEKMMERLISGDYKIIFGTILSNFNIGLMKVEEHIGKRRKKQEKISILYQSIRTRNSLPLSSSRSFRTQSHWSLTTGQCINSRQFLRVHLSYWMCSQFTLHHKFTIDSGRTKFEQKTDGIFHACGSYGQGTQRSVQAWLDETTSSWYKHEWKRHQDTVYWVDFQLAQRKGLKFYQTI